MASNTFFGDPKVYLSLLAILVSIIAFIFTLANQTEQNRRWDSLNIGNVVIKETEFIKCNSMTIEEAQATNWGYNVLLLANNEAPRMVYTINSLQIFDANTHELIPYSKFCRTVVEVNEEIEDVHRLPADILIRQVVKGRIVLENIGKTEVRNLSAILNRLMPDGNWSTCFQSEEKRNLGASQKLNVPMTLNFTLQQNIPVEMTFEIKWEYQDANDVEHKKYQKMKWIRSENKWNFLEGEGQ